MVKKSPRVAIVGAGITGLTAAWELRRRGIDAQVFEKSSVVGGRTLSLRQGGFVFDTGAITMLPTYDQTCSLIEQLGIGHHLHRYAPVIGIPRDGEIHDLDLGKPVKSLLNTRLVSGKTKLKLLKLLPVLLRVWKRAQYSSLAPLAPWGKESIASWAERELGHELHNYVVGPIIRGNTLNATEDAPFGELLWMLKGYSAPFVQNFGQGINFLAESLAETAAIQFETRIDSIEERHGVVELRGVSDEGEFRGRFDACVVALPPPDMNKLQVAIPPEQRQFLRELKPLPSVNFHFGLRTRPAPHQTFILPPASESENLTTVVLDHNKAPGRAPKGKGVISLFCRDAWCSDNFDRPETELIPEVLMMAEPFIGDIRGDIETHVVQRWPYAIIKSEVGLYQRIAGFEAAVDTQSRIQLAGDFLSLGMEAGVISGLQAAGRLRGVL